MAADGVFVGRLGELAQVDELLEGAQSGRAGGLFVLGEAGVGKSRLFAEGSRLAARRGMQGGGCGVFTVDDAVAIGSGARFAALVRPASWLHARHRGEVFWTAVEQLEQSSVSRSAPLVS